MWSWPFVKDLCEPHHLVLIVIVFVLALMASGAGKGIVGLIAAILSKWKGGGNTINIGGGAMAGGKGVPKECEGCGLVVDPKKCVMHQSEHERSKRNEAQIASLWEEYGKLRNENLAAAAKLREEMAASFKEVNRSISDSNSSILSALAGTRTGFGEGGKGGRN